MIKEKVVMTHTMFKSICAGLIFSLIFMLSGCSEKEEITSLQQLNGKEFAVMSGGTADKIVLSKIPTAKFKYFNTVLDACMAVKTGKADVAVSDEPILKNIAAKSSGLTVISEMISYDKYGFAVQHENQELKKNIDLVVSEIRNNGVYDDMMKRWVPKTGGPAPMPDIPSSGSNGVLKLGTATTNEPFSFVDGSQNIVGFDVEIARRVAQKIDKKLEILNMDFGAMIPALISGKVDMIAAGITITHERAKKILFSEYYTSGMAALVRDETSKLSGSGQVILVNKSAAGPVAFVSFFKNIANSFNSNIIQENRYLLILDGLETTVLISVLATVFGSLLGALICFMRMSKNALLNLPARIYISILRGTPVLVLLMLIFYVVFASVNINPLLVAVIAFGMNFAAYVAEIFRTGIEGVDKGQTEAGIALGFTKVTTFLNIVLPQTVRRILPIYKGEFISLVKMTSIVGYIAVQDLTKASDIIRSRTFDAFFPLVMVAILYFLISWVLMQSLECLERKTDPKYKRNKERNS